MLRAKRKGISAGAGVDKASIQINRRRQLKTDYDLYPVIILGVHNAA